MKARIRHLLGYVLVLMVCGATRVFGQACHIAHPLEDTASNIVEVRITPQWSKPGHAFEGWGTALAWFANVTGQLPAPIRTHLADLLYGKEGLQLNIARYNIGGGNSPETKPYLRKGADISGFWRRPDGMSTMDSWNPEDERQWDWSADPGQRWWLDAIRERVPEHERIFEAFSNSPPYFMTVSGLVSGNEDGLADNLRPGYEAKFADYLVRVTTELEKRHHIVFRTLSPVNEPNTPYWHADNTQEGAHWSPQRQTLMIKALSHALRSHNLSTQISGVDETNAQTFMVDWSGLDTEAKADIDQINVHSYDTTGKAGVRDIAESTGKRLWMSEVDLSAPNVRQDYNDMRPAIALGEQIISDVNRLKPVAWVLWQAIEKESPDPKTGSNWGLIKVNFADPVSPDIHLTSKYWVMGNFTKYLRPGYRFVPVDDDDTVIAIRRGTPGFIAVHVNPGPQAQRLRINLPPEAKLGPMKRSYRVSRIVTDIDHHLQKESQVLRSKDGSVIVPPKSVTTLRFEP